MAGLGAALPLISAAATVGSAIMDSRAKSRAKREQDEQIARMRRMEADATRRNLGITEEATAQYEPTRRLAALDEAGATAGGRMQSYLDAVRSPADTASGGKVSDAFLTEQGRRQVAGADFARQIASLMGRLRGPIDLATEEGMTMANAATRRATNSADATSDLRAGDIRYQSIEPSTGMQLGSSVLGAIGGLTAGQLALPQMPKAPGVPRYGVASGKMQRLG